jgi:hypothetical protein
VSRTGLVRLAALLGAAACVLVALKVLPTFQIGTDLGRQPAVIVNDTATAVGVGRCADAGCTRSTGSAVVAPGGELRAGDSARWVVEAGGTRLGCLVAAPGRRLLVSAAQPCPG